MLSLYVAGVPIILGFSQPTRVGYTRSYSMPLRDIDDIRSRMRPPSDQRERPRFINDIGSQQRRVFPDVGVTLPLQRPRPVTVRPAENRPRQPMARHTANTQPTQLLRPALASAVAPAASIATPVPQIAKPKRRRKIITKKRIALLVVALLLASGIWFGFKAISNLQKVFHGSLFSILTTTKLRGEDSGRVNILLAGNSADDPGHDGANLTDSIMLVSIDVKDNTAFMLSIPRDLWVDIPGYGHAKINEAYVDGENGNFSDAGYPSGGMGLLEETVQQTFGIKPDYYALVNYDALKDSVNAVGGIDFTVNSSDPRGLYDPSLDYTSRNCCALVKLTNGVHHLDGQQALDLARARGDAPGSYGFPRSDFDRTEHQREIIVDVKAKALSAGTLANPITLSNLFDTIGKNVRTDFTLGEVRRAADILKNINNNSVQSVGLNDANGVDYFASYASPNGESALIPAAGIDDFSKIQAYISRLMTSNPIVKEGATVVVLNGTDMAGLAAKAQTTLSSKDINVAAIGDASAPLATTTIINASGGQKPATLALLKQIYGTQVTASNPYASVYTADFIVVLGSDQLGTSPAQ